MSHENAVNHLLKFFSEMNAWEAQTWTAQRNGTDGDEQIGNELNEIFKQYCTSKERKTGRQASLTCSSPPEYDPATQVILSVEEAGKKIIIYTEQLNRLKNKYRYTLTVKDHEYKIDKKEMFDSFEEKWIKTYL